MENSPVFVLVPIVASGGFFALVAWIVFVFVDGKRRREQLKVTSEFNTKILDKMGSTAEFGAFLDTDGGKRFMKSLTVEGPERQDAHARQHPDGNRLHRDRLGDVDSRRNLLLSA